MRFISTLIRYLTFLLALAGVGGIFMVMRELHAQQPVVTAPPIAPATKAAPDDIAATGILEARDENVAIGVPAAGLVQEVKVRVNQTVKAGDPLLQLDDRELKALLLRQKASVAVAQAQFVVAEAQLAKLQDMLDRLKSVPDQRAISQDDLRNRSNDVTVAKAQLQAAQAELDAAKADVEQTGQLIDRLLVRAPRGGTLLQVNIRAGEYASPQNKLPALILGDIGTLHVRADVDEQNATAVQLDAAAKISLKSDSSRSFQAAFVRVEPYVIPKTSLTGASTERVDTRVLQIIYRLEKPADTPLYVGQQVDVFIPRRKAPAK